jgi:hypothetical protein
MQTEFTNLPRNCPNLLQSVSANDFALRVRRQPTDFLRERDVQAASSVNEFQDASRDNGGHTLDVTGRVCCGRVGGSSEGSDQAELAGWSAVRSGRRRSVVASCSAIFSSWEFP